jgi:asparagine synthase (glutamine-hydrolysing)
MCGITGVYNFNKEKKVNLSRLKKMTNKLYHRGPDGEGFYCNKNIGLGHRRLSIIDLITGDQPMFNDDKTISLVFNGEIYNYIELRKELINKGHKFRSNSDTEVIIRSYEEWGVSCQNKFNGMWSFALWDGKQQQLFLSRDRIGEKPLNYGVYDNSIVFSSEIKSIFSYGFPKIIRPELIELYLVLTNIPAPDTFYKNIFKLKPGHYIIANSNGYKEYKYWDLPFVSENEMIKDKKYIYKKFEDLFSDSIKIRMRSDVPFGAFLSGGLDSSCIVSQMSNFSSEPIQTFTIGFPEKDFDESSLANLVSKKFSTSHYVGTVSPHSVKDAIDLCVNHFDEPFGDSSSIPTFQVSKFARKKVKMVLTGDGGDEVLSGYNTYLGLKLNDYYLKFPSFFRYSIDQILKSSSLIFKGRKRYKLNQIIDFVNFSSFDFNKKIINKIAFNSLDRIKELTSEIKELYSIEDYMSTIMNNCNYKDDFYKLMYLNFKHNLPDDYLVKVDRMSMSNSIETRAPFLDYRLIEFMACVDKTVKMQGLERKSILRKTFANKLPKKILKSPKKGFAVPLREWFKDDLNNNFLKLSNLEEICDSKILNKIKLENYSGMKDNGNFLWSLIMLDNFIEIK